MNYFEHHIGDYAEATAHLSFVEDAAYSRLIRKYYAKELPLPAEIKAAQRLVGARTKEECAAVETVLREFFVLQADGWHQDRCDEVIAIYKAGEPEREQKRANEETRLKKHREERSRMFQRLASAGQHPAWNTKMPVLRALFDTYCNGPETPPETDAETLARTLPATETATPRTATQSPIPNPQSPGTNLNYVDGHVCTSGSDSELPADTDNTQEPVSGIDSPQADHDAFESIKAVYPPFSGKQNWITAEHYARLRIDNDGLSWSTLQQAVERYARYCATGGASGPQYVMTPAKFFSDENKPWLQAWIPPPTKADQRQQANIDASLEWLART